MATLRRDGRPAPAPSSVMVASTGGPFIPSIAQPLPGRRTAEVPVPPNRPFEPRYPAQLASAAPFEPRTTFADRPVSPQLIPVSALSPAIVTGRGLY
jgi:rare lipoprotein A